MFEIKVEAQFKAELQANDAAVHPQLKSEFKAAVAELAAHGSLPAEYGAHELWDAGRQLTTGTSTSTYPTAWSTGSFSTCRIRLTR